MMKIVRKTLNPEKKKLEIEVENERHTFLVLLRDVLEQDEDILYASYRLEHPVLSNPTFRVSLRPQAEGDVAEHVIRGAERIKEMCVELEQLLNQQGIKNASL